MNPTRSARHARLVAPLIAAAALFTAAGGFVHMREWLNSYRHLPTSVPGSAVVRLGFPINAASSAALVVALLVCLFVPRRFVTPVVWATALFQASSLIFLFASRTSNVFGWSETVWTVGASETRAVEIGALLLLVAVLVADAANRRVVAVPAPARARSASVFG